MNIKRVLIMLLFITLTSCSNAPSEEDGWVFDKEANYYVREITYSEDDPILIEYLEAYEGTWSDTSDPETMIIINDGEILVDLNTNNGFFPIDTFELESREYASKESNYEPSGKIYTLTLDTPYFFKDYITEMKIWLTTLEKEALEKTDYGFMFNVYLTETAGGGTAIYSMENSNLAYSSRTENETSQNISSNTEDKYDTSDYEGFPYITLDNGSFELNNKEEFEIRGFYNNLDLNDLIWYADKQKIGFANDTGDSAGTFVLPISSNLIDNSSESTNLKAVDSSDKNIVYLEENIILSTNTKSNQALLSTEVYEKYSEDQLKNFGIQSEPAEVDSNDLFTIEIFMDEKVDPNDFKFFLSGEEVSLEFNGSYNNRINSYTVQGNINKVFEYDNYKKQFGEDYYYIMLEVKSKNEVIIFSDYTDYINY